MIREVQKAILASGIPRFLYIRELAAAKATKGNPIANQVDGTHYTGDRFFESFVIKLKCIKKES